MSIILEIMGYMLGDAAFNRLVSVLRVEPLIPPHQNATGEEKNSETMSELNSKFDDPVYKKNLQRLIERNRQFEEERNERHS